MLSEYNTKINNMFNQQENKFLFEMTKCCGYGYFQLFFKLSTLEEMYRAVELELSHLKIHAIYLKDCNNLRLDIPRDPNLTLRDFFYANQQWFIPIYPLPANVVYRVFFDDNHFHIHENNDSTSVVSSVDSMIIDNNV